MESGKIIYQYSMGDSNKIKIKLKKKTARQLVLVYLPDKRGDNLKKKKG